MNDNIFVAMTFDEAEDFLSDMEDRSIPDLDTCAATDDVIRRIKMASHANRNGIPVKPSVCLGGVRSTCISHPAWRVREKNDSNPRNWVWVCSKHLATTCADLGERVELDVIRCGL